MSDIKFNEEIGKEDYCFWLRIFAKKVKNGQILDQMAILRLARELLAFYEIALQAFMIEIK